MSVKKILFTTSTMPTSDQDPVPAFVREEAIWLHKIYPDTSISVLAPHNAYSRTETYTRHQHYDEYRFHYFWPFAWEKLTGRGIQPALNKNKLLYLQLPGLFIAEFFATWKYVRKLKPDLIYAHWFTPQAITAALVSKITGVPFVFDTQASDVIVLKNVPFAHKIVASVCQRALAYTAPSQQTASKLLYFATKDTRKMIESKLHLIPMGANRSPSRKSIAQKLRKTYVLNDKTILLFMGRLVDRKGVDILIKAVKEIDKINVLRLVIAGDGQERKNLEELVSKLDMNEQVVFTGFVTGVEKEALLTAADILVIPSVNVGDHSEGLPIVFMEGVLAGKITVISDATGAHEVVSDGVNSFIFSAGSVKGLVNKLDRALNLRGSKLRKFEKSIEELSKEYSWENIIRKRYAALLLGPQKRNK